MSDMQRAAFFHRIGVELSPFQEACMADHDETTRQRMEDELLAKGIDAPGARFVDADAQEPDIVTTPITFGLDTDRTACPNDGQGHVTHVFVMGHARCLCGAEPAPGTELRP